MKKSKVLFLSCAILVSITACTENGMLLHSSGKDYIMEDVNGIYKIGTPYQVNGKWYYPKEDFTYKQDGIASWYGEDFHNGLTANGETYNMYAMTASHKTLPLPSIVKVTNLENGKSVVVRVNDRGPFVNYRIIDVSKAVAKKLGFYEEGTTRVHIEVMEKESKELKQKILDNGGRIVNGAPIPEQLPVASNAVTATDLPNSKATPEPVPQDANKDIIYSPKKQPITANMKGYYIQLGAFKSYDNALALQKRFEAFNDTKVVSVNNSKGQLYRVRIGPFSEAESAIKMMDEVREKTQHSDMRLVEEK